MINDIMHLNTLVPTLPPSQARWGFDLYYEFQMPHIWDITISQIPTLSLLPTLEMDGYLTW